MRAARILPSLLCTFALAACMAPQAAQPTSAPPATQPPATQPPATQPPATEPVQPAPTAAAEQATSASQPTAAATAQPTPAGDAAGPTPTPVVPTRLLMLQDPALQGDDIRAVQQRLLELGYSQVGAVDSIFGARTQAAVSAFQQASHLQADGVVGPQTRIRLFSPEAAMAVVPIVVHDYSNFLLGGVQAGAWLPAPAAASLLAGGERYRVVGGRSETSAIGGKPAQMDVICTDAYTVSLEPDMSGDQVVAVGGSWPLQPRTPSELPANDPSIRQDVATFLQAKAIKQPEVQITRAISIDLEGDGEDELVLNATRLSTQNQDPTDAGAGDYSFVAVRKNVNGKPTMIELAGNYFPQAGDFVAPNQYRLLAVLDLNGDGTLELVVNGAYYEGAFTSALRIEGDTAHELLGTGCGV